ncbi:methyltransferase domain-containing protein [Streptomyces bauhiniae]|uniref:Class I SAM-dependent methyltransferase n=1 Tax=Streptomyces bauhiniae TaxID=2340725 RepID=A0A7K3R231_9ACTN|nr:class I SAM-dependent methyltransferase [Streptomyces bauhiniae]
MSGASGTRAALLSPENGAPLVPRGSGLLDDGERLWPVVEGIPWLRAGREELRERAVALLAAGAAEEAALALLADSDDWWDEEPPHQERLRQALRATTMRQAVAALGMGRVGDYFLHRWSDPSWLALLALTRHHPPGGLPVVELACGAGHLLRQLELAGARRVTGVDVVFAKLWLGRRFVCPTAGLVCADVSRPWPLPARGDCYVACHDALYFVRDKEAVVRRAVRHAGPGGAIVLGHCHVAGAGAPSAGLPLTAPAWGDLLPGCTLYGDGELTRAYLERRAPRAVAAHEAVGEEAVALVRAPGGVSDVDLPAGRPLRLNPLYDRGRLVWPGERWRGEYGPAMAYLPERIEVPAAVLADAHAGRMTPQVGELARRRVLVDLPEHW